MEVKLGALDLKVLQSVADGLSSKDIAANMGITTSTVRGHIHRCMKKLGVDNRSQAVLEGFKRGLVTSDYITDSTIHDLNEEVHRLRKEACQSKEKSPSSSDPINDEHRVYLAAFDAHLAAYVSGNREFEQYTRDHMTEKLIFVRRSRQRVRREGDPIVAIANTIAKHAEQF